MCLRSDGGSIREVISEAVIYAISTEAMTLCCSPRHVTCETDIFEGGELFHVSPFRQWFYQGSYQ